MPETPRGKARRIVAGAEVVAAAVIDAGETLPGRRRKRPLPNLYEVHPEARLAPMRELGLCAIPVDEVIGTAVQGVAQRGLDFRPLPAFRSTNWRGRFQRIREALDRLETLPPIDVLKTAEGYWVIDGHNRVSAARANGQVAIDADVRYLMLPGQPVVLPGSLAPVLTGSDEIRAVGRGRFTPGLTTDSRVGDRTLDPDADPDPDPDPDADPDPDR
jgi:hypothetical protein